MTENEISFLIRKAIFKVYNNLGPGLFESVYEKEGIKFEASFRLDILVNNLVIIEVKSTETLAEVYHKQVLTYLKLSGLKLGILVNFNAPNIAESIYRKVNGLK